MAGSVVKIHLIVNVISSQRQPDLLFLTKDELLLRARTSVQKDFAEGNCSRQVYNRNRKVFIVCEYFRGCLPSGVIL
jgi:hypothetical protein